MPQSTMPRLTMSINWTHQFSKSGPSSNTTTDELDYVYTSALIQTNELDQLLEFDGGSDNRIITLM